MNYKLFGRSGLRVSEVCLGAMTFGTEWGKGADFDESKKIFEVFTSAGGNFIDTANRYTEGTSEKYVGKLIESDRDYFVIATKYSLYTRRDNPNDGGNHRKNMMASVEGSLKRLGTEYVDILYLHAWDFTTSIEEVLRGLDDLVRMGKVNYIAISDTPAWIISRGVAISELRGWSTFCGVQVEYSLIQRSAEREYLPMAEYLDLAITAWAPLAGGALTGKYLRKDDSPKRLSPQSARLAERAVKISEAVVRIADEVGVPPAQVALRWLYSRGQNIFPVIGARTAQQLSENLGFLNISLLPQQISSLNDVSAIEAGFPNDFLSAETTREVIFGGMFNRIINHRKK